MRTDVLGLTFLGFVLVITSLTGCNATSGWSANNTGAAYYKQGNYTAARDSFRRAAIDDPENVDYRYNLAAAMKKQGDIAGAEKEYRNALNIVPEHQPSNHGLAELLHGQGRTAEATSAMQEWVAVAPNSPQPHIETAWLQRETGNTAGAEQSLQQALKFQPRNPVALAQLGQLYQGSGRSTEAVAMYQQSLHGNWNQPEVHSRLSSLQGPPSAQRQRTQMAAATPMYGAPNTTMAYGQPSFYGQTGPTNFAQVPMLNSVPNGQMAQPTMISPLVEADPAHATEVE
jgi:Tfp pilus assembly protein PilF